LAKRDKLTKRQKRQIVKTQKKKSSNQNLVPEFSNLGVLLEGLMISRFGEQADVLDIRTAGRYRCFLRQNLGAPVPGDHVKFRLDKNNQGIIESIDERSSLLERPSFHQGLKPVVANINRVFVFVAPLPDFSSVLLDRYLIALENAKMDIVIVANKWDLTEEIEQQSINQQLAVYQALDYPVIKISTKEDVGKECFIKKAFSHSSILVGQSGVGKSSVINWLFPKQSLTVQSISENSRLGQHTTTASQLFCWSDKNIEDGFIIDSPGIREFGLWHLNEQQIASGYKEFRPYIGSCKYRDCKHIKEPGCKILEAVEKQLIPLIRWKNYTKILANNQKK